MTSPALTELLFQASEVFGITPGYWAIDGTRHETSDELRLMILRARGIECGTVERLRLALDERARDSARVLVEPAVVALESEQPLRIKVNSEAGPARLWLRHEGGTMESHAVEVVDSAVTLPVRLPLGYHDMEIQVGARSASTRLAVCPDRAWLPTSLAAGQRRAGLAVSLFGLRGAATWGCGDFTALRTLIDWVAEIGGAYVALNPLHAIQNRQPFNTSPYLPNSTFFRNFIYLDIDAIPEMRLSLVARALRQHKSTLAAIGECNASDLVEYEKVAALKRRFLKVLWDHFEREEITSGTPRAVEFQRFVAEEGELLDRFAVYSALDDYFHAQNPNVWVWPDWPEEYRDPQSPAVLDFRERHLSVVAYYKYVQWLVDGQASEAQKYALNQGLEIGLFHDLPLATDRCGSELWANRRFFIDGCRVGAPPDDFAPKGQDWSFPPPDRDAHRADGYRLFAESIRKSAKHGGALRIDHVMRLFRLYWIPDGCDATQGAYVLDYPEDLLRILALESHRNRVLIVGEDLGTVEPWMREALDRYGILSYRLFYFEKRRDGSMIPPAEYPVRALVSSTTHDLPTLAGFWAGADIDTRFALGLIPDEHSREEAAWFRAEDKRRMFAALKDARLLPEGYTEAAALGRELTGELHSAITGFLASTPSLLMTLNQEDLTKEIDQQNLPGTTWQYPNWRRKTKLAVEELHTSKLARDVAAMLRDWLERTGRHSPRH